MRLVRKLAAFAFLLVLTGCANDSADDLLPPPTPQGQIITYNKDVEPIISRNCLSCHSNPPRNGAPIPLTSYEFVKAAVQDHGLLDRISRPQGAEGMMPFGGTRLPESTINIIVLWQQQGLQE